ncbi:MAG TPA: DUF805 domain-containing protein [Paludibacter sp.]|nr:DUF805 domain-containing protein [Paludibacter sp.]
MNWYLKVLKQYLDFSGRARRKEYWMFILFNIIFSAIAMTIDYLLGLSVMGSGPITMIYSLAILIPSIAVVVRRLHDINKSGAWILIGFIPLLGAIWLLVLLIKAGVVGDNQYGPDPKIDLAQ